MEQPPIPAGDPEDGNTTGPWWERLLSPGTNPLGVGSIVGALMFLGVLLAARNPTAALVLAFPAATLGLMAIVLAIVARRLAIRLAAAVASLALTLSSGLALVLLGLWRVALIQWVVYMVLILVGGYRLDRERAAEARNQMQDTETIE